MRIEVFSDFVCPWCFIGARRLFSAIERHCAGFPGAQPAVRWRAFLLNPRTPPEGEPYGRFMENKFGSAEAVAELHARVGAAARADGIEIDFEALRVRPSTRAAHALVGRLQRAGHDPGRLVMGLFEAHFLRGLNIGSEAVLARLLAESGLPGGLLGGSPEDLQQVDAEARRRGLQAVPLFLFDGGEAISGARSAGELLAAVQRAATAAS